MLCRKTGIYALSLLFLLASLGSSASAGVNHPIDRLILNDGGEIRLFVGGDAPFLEIAGGKAHRVPRKPELPEDMGKNVVELDIETRTFHAKTSARHIALLGAFGANVAGISGTCWGTLGAPALYIGMDCAVSLHGTARSEAVIRVSPLARVTIDARKLSTPAIGIIGNPSTVVRRGKNTDVRFYEDRSKPRIRTSGEGGGQDETAPEEPMEEQPAADRPQENTPGE